MVLVRFEPEGLTAEVPVGVTLHEAAAEAGVTVAAPCGGLGRCGSCRVRATGGVRGPGATEAEALGPAIASGVRLACLARVEGPDDVVVIGDAVVPRPRTVEPVAFRGSVERAAAGTAAAQGPLGAAVDIGTTTLGVRIHALRDGAILAEAASGNPQAALGADVLARVSRALAGEAPALHALVTAEVERLVASCIRGLGLEPARLERLVVVGNPTMTHLFLGADVAPLASLDTGGLVLEPVALDAADAGMPALAGARVFPGPAASAFVGADAVAGVVATGIAGREDPALLLDLGTNGEVVLAAGGRLFAASAAAGPAFEAVGITSGMRAEDGAIDRVWRDDGLRFATIGGAAPRGLCGSGLLDLVAVLRESSAIDPDGLMPPRETPAGEVVDTEGGSLFRLTGDVVLTQRDVRTLQLATAAVAVAIDVTVQAADLAAEDVREVVISGGFGSHLRPSSLAALGVIPAAWRERVTLGGNTALAGASAMLLSDDALAGARRVARSIETIRLAERADFQARYLAALRLGER